MATPSPRLLTFIANFEQFRSKAYLDPVGVWTIGYGTTRIYGLPIQRGMEINEPVAKLLLYADALDAMQAVERLVTRPLTTNQRDALTSLVYNIGAGIKGFAGSTLLRELNLGNPIVRDYFTRWNKGRVHGVLTTLDGLVTRRGLEYQLFMQEDRGAPGGSVRA